MDINCPYCDAELEINHDDGFGYEENVDHQMQCDCCEKDFFFQTSISFHYEAKKADCLNNGQHNYKPMHTHPSAFSLMKCTSCGEKREPTDEERKTFNLGSKESYFMELETKKQSR